MLGLFLLLILIGGVFGVIGVLIAMDRTAGRVVRRDEERQFSKRFFWS